MGHRLICCNACGQIYAANAAKQLYIEPNLNKQLSGIDCMACGRSLTNNWSYYPDNYRGKDGMIHNFDRPREIPSEADSIVKEFPEVYS